MTHPDQSILALYAGEDLGWFSRKRTERHLAGCPQCRDEVRELAAVREELAALKELPEISWNRLAIEMKANIRLGLAAGECVRTRAALRMDGCVWPALQRQRPLAACASVMVLVAVGLVLERPVPVMPAAAVSDNAVLRQPPPVSN